MNRMPIEPYKYRCYAFSLIELLIVLALAAIIATFSVASYRQYALRANRTDAMTLLLKVAAAQERWHLQHRRYAGDAEALGFAGHSSTNGYYSVHIMSNNPALDFTATAIPNPEKRQAADAQCQQLSITQTGQRASLPMGPQTCWQ